MQSIGIAAAPKFGNQPSSSPAKITRSSSGANTNAAAKTSTAAGSTSSANNKTSVGASRVSAVHLASSDNEGAAGGNWDDELDDLIGDD